MKLKRNAAMTLIEILIAVAIVADVLIIAVPSYQRALRTTQNTRFAADMRSLGTGFELYFAENGVWPADRAEGVVPPGMAQYLRSTRFSDPTPIGGHWNWDLNGAGGRAAISVTTSALDPVRAQDLDQKLDNGALATGVFRQAVENQVTYALQL